MGQSWKLLNLDKEKCSHVGKLGEALFSGPIHVLAFLVTPDDPQSDTDELWAGDRLICVGNYVMDYPEGLLTDKEVAKLERDELDLYSAPHKECESAYAFPTGPDIILRNLSKQQYVCADALVSAATRGPDDESYNDKRRRQNIRGPGLTEVMVARISWSSDPSAACGYFPSWPGTRELNRGIWAGDRFDIVRRDRFKQRSGWKNVSEEVAKEVFAIWADEYDREHFGSKQRNRSIQSIPVSKPFPEHPVEITQYILNIVMQEDKTAALYLILLSKTIQQWMTPKIYNNVILDFRRVEGFQATLESSRGNELGGLVRRLFMSISASNGPKPQYCKNLAKALESCPNIEFLMTDCPLSDVVMEEDKAPAPWSLMFIICEEPQVLLPAIAHPLLRNVTHLCINSADLATLSTLETTMLPRLTHLGVHCRYEDKFDWADLIRKVLKTFSTSLKMILLLSCRVDLRTTSFKGEKWENVAKIEDERLFARPGLAEDEYEDMMSERATFWDNADQLWGDWREKCIVI